PALASRESAGQRRPDLRVGSERACSGRAGLRRARANSLDLEMQLPANIGKYELTEFLGGGMSQVYLARDTVIDRPVVVKILTVEATADPEAKARSLQEARVAGNIQH